MTAEIAIYNAHGIALAADSAVSIFDSQKIYNSVNKLFMLSKNRPVAIMIYNAATMLRVPWETIIKSFRRELGTKSFDHLEQYADEFWSYIEQRPEWFPNKDQENFIAEQTQHTLYTLRNEFIKGVNESGTSAKDTKALEAVIHHIITRKLTDVSALEYCENFSVHDVIACEKHYSNLFEQLAEEVFEGVYLSIMTPSDRKKLMTICAITLTKKPFDLYSGIVIAGYGEAEIFPKIASYQVGMFANNKLRKFYDHKKSNLRDKEFTARIIPYAQDDVAITVIKGVSPDANQLIVQLLEHIPNIADLIPNDTLTNNKTIDDGIRRRLKDLLTTNISKIIDAYYRGIYDTGTQPILEMLEVLPKDELAVMADTLVNLTAFKRRMSTSKESVGGPIDVAIISKGDGFIWSKRKHYFKPELNPHFFHNYYQE